VDVIRCQQTQKTVEIASTPKIKVTDFFIGVTGMVWKLNSRVSAWIISPNIDGIMKIKTAWLSEMRGALGRPFLGGMNCFRTDQYGNIVGLKSPSEPRVPSGMQRLYRHQLRYWSLHWNFLTPEQKLAYSILGAELNITGYNYYIKEKYDINHLYIAPTDNRWVELWHPSTNPSAEEGLHLSDDEEFEDWVYINFYPDKFPKNLVITKAELWFFYYNEAGDPATGRHVDCHRLLEPWSETTITYNTRPGATAARVAAAVMPGEWQWFYFDLTFELRFIIAQGMPFYGYKIKFRETVTEESSMCGLRSTWPHDNDWWPFLKLEL